MSENKELEDVNLEDLCDLEYFTKTLEFGCKFNKGLEYYNQGNYYSAAKELTGISIEGEVTGASYYLSKSLKRNSEDRPVLADKEEDKYYSNRYLEQSALIENYENAVYEYMLKLQSLSLNVFEFMKNLNECEAILEKIEEGNKKEKKWLSKHRK